MKPSRVWLWSNVLLCLDQRFASEKEGDREVQRTMLELLNQLDGFSSHSEIKVGLHAYYCSSQCVCVLFLCGTGHSSNEQGRYP